MKLSIQDFLLFFNGQYSNFGVFSKDSDIRGMGIDGIDAEDMICDITNKFSVEFHDFPFEKYFLYEAEITKSLAWFGLKKTRVVSEILTINTLYEYILNNNLYQIPSFITST